MLFKSCINIFQMIFMLNLCLMSKAMEDVALRIKYTYNPLSSGVPSEKIEHLSFSQEVTGIKRDQLISKVNNNLTPDQQKQKKLILRGYNKGTEEVILSSFTDYLSIQDLRDMEYLRVVIFDK